MTLSSSLPRTAGRALLWAGLLFLLIRGALAVMAPAEGRSSGTARSASPRTFPDSGAVAFAVGFARSYFTHARGSTDGSAGLRRYLTSELDSDAGSVVHGGMTATALQTTSAKVVQLDGRHALITVRVDLAATNDEVRYLTVPVATAGHGDFAVFDYPSLAPPPKVALETTRPAEEPLDSSVESEVRPLLGRFFRSYLGGSSGELAYFTPPGVRLGAVRGTFDGIEIVELGAVGTPSPGRLTVRATVRARDRELGTTALLSYRVVLAREGRWYVAAVNTSGKD